jgi:hypothetical protein
MNPVFMLLPILCLVAAAPALSCSCVEREPIFEDQVAEAFATATSVFFGEVESVETFVETPTMADRKAASSQGLTALSTEWQVVHIKVLRSWKGDKKPGDRILARTIMRYFCGMEMMPRERWLVYAYSDEPISVSQCSRSRRTTLDSPDIPIIERIRRGEPAREPLPEPHIEFDD